MNNLPAISNTLSASAKPAQGAQAKPAQGTSAKPAQGTPAPLAANPTQATKVAQGAKPVQAVKSEPAAKASESSDTQGKAFGDVLARQVSDAASTEDTSQPKKITAKSTDEILSNIKGGGDEEATTALPINANLPSDMLATLIPFAVAGSQAAQDGSQASQDSQGVTQASQDVSQASQGVSQATQGVSQASQGVTQAAQDVTQAAQGVTQAAQGVAQATQGVPLASRGVSQSSRGGAQAVSVEAKDDLGIDSKLLVASNKSQDRALPVSVDAKKDATFSNMMETITASTTAKLSDKDEKGAALAAAPQPNAASLLSAAAPLTQVAAMPTQVTINTPVSHEKWGDEFNQKITWLSNQKEQTAELHLNPPQLGPMDVVLKVSGDQATALFTSPHAAVREAVEQAMPRLREMLAESGITLGNATVSDQAPRNRQDEGERKSSSSRSSIGGVADSAATSNLSARVSPISRHNGIVDTFA